MIDTEKKAEGPACACGKADLYEEWVKQNEKEAVSADTDPADKGTFSSDDTSNQDPKPEQTRK